MKLLERLEKFDILCGMKYLIMVVWARCIVSSDWVRVGDLDWKCGKGKKKSKNHGGFCVVLRCLRCGKQTEKPFLPN